MAYGNSSSDGVYGGNVDTAAANSGELSSGLFPGHPRSGPWETLKGSALGRWEMASDMTPDNTGDPRFNGQVEGPMGWEASLKPHEGLTRGTDKNMPR